MRHEPAGQDGFTRSRHSQTNNDGQPDLPSGGRHAEVPDGGQRDYLV
jgi:hypothetical protein